jgi:hypothetical protein
MTPQLLQTGKAFWAMRKSVKEHFPMFQTHLFAERNDFPALELFPIFKPKFREVSQAIRQDVKFWT